MGWFTPCLTPKQLSALGKPLKQWIPWRTESFTLPLCCSQSFRASFVVGSFNTTIINISLLGWSLWLAQKGEKLLLNSYFKITQLFQLSSTDLNLPLTGPEETSNTHPGSHGRASSQIHFSQATTLYPNTQQSSPTCSCATVTQGRACNAEWHLMWHPTSGAQLAQSWTFCLPSFPTNFLSQALTQTSSYSRSEICPGHCSGCGDRDSVPRYCVLFLQENVISLPRPELCSGPQEQNCHRRHRLLYTGLASWQPTKWPFPCTGGQAHVVWSRKELLWLFMAPPQLYKKKSHI